MTPHNLDWYGDITLRTGKGQIRILGNYWPFPASTTKEEQGLWNKTAQYLKQARVNKDPQEYIKSIITGKAE